MDKDGYIYFVDRVKDYIRRRGGNISSFEVEKIVNSHPDVEESATIGIKSEAGKYAEDELMILVIPRFIRFVDSFPKTGTQRTQKNKLREQGVTKDT